MKYIAYTTKGLEQVSSDEIKHLLPEAEIGEIKTKRIVFETDNEPQILLQLRTVDDVGVLVSKTGASTTEDVVSFAETLDFNEAISVIEQVRDIGKKFSITATLAGVQGYKSGELIERLSKVFTSKMGLQFSEIERLGFDIKIFVDRNEVYCSVRLAEESLHNRRFKTHSKEGSLKSTIAASLVQLACGWDTNLKVVDNFCGSGTILAEALLAGNQVFGGDIDPESVQITIKNLQNLHYKAEGKIKVLDATDTNWSNGCFDCAISNLPWGKQVEINHITSLYAGTMKEYQRILKPDGKLCLIVSNPELLVKYAKRYFPDKRVTTNKIGFLGQNPTIVLIT